LLWSLSVCNLRNIRSCYLDFEPGLTIVSGANGAGKTSLLESIYLLGRGRSFRGRRAGEITSEGECESFVNGYVGVDQGDVRRWIYRRRGTTGSRTVDGIPLSDSIGARFHVRLVGENAQTLFDSDGSLRRRFLDWNLFHVEPKFGPAWFRFRRVASQRNAWLRQGASGQAIWDAEFLAAATDIDVLRRGFCQKWVSAFGDLKNEFRFTAGLELSYQPGWPSDEDLFDSLLQDAEVERRLGYTRKGPGRADFSVTRGARSARFSRGQAKVVVCLLQLAARAVDVSTTAGESVWLLDDLGSDLDSESFATIVRLFSDTGDQCVMTQIDAGLRDLPRQSSLFHVEQGKVRKLVPNEPRPNSYHSHPV